MPAALADLSAGQRQSGPVAGFQPYFQRKKSAIHGKPGAGGGEARVSLNLKMYRSTRVRESRVSGG